MTKGGIETKRDMNTEGRCGIVQRSNNVDFGNFSKRIRFGSYFLILCSVLCGNSWKQTNFFMSGNYKSAENSEISKILKRMNEIAFLWKYKKLLLKSSKKKISQN